MNPYTIPEETMLDLYQRYVRHKMQQNPIDPPVILGYGSWKQQIYNELERPNPWDNGK